MREERAKHSRKIRLVVNGTSRELKVPVHRTLLEILREDLGLTGAKEGCGIGECGACTVLMNDEAVNACLVLAVQADGAQITTIEGLTRPDGTLHPVQEAFIEADAVHCGFCTPGMIMSALALLRRRPQPTRAEIIEALAGNLCRCTGYHPIIAAVEAAARRGVTPGAPAAPSDSAEP